MPHQRNENSKFGLLSMFMNIYDILALVADRYMMSFVSLGLHVFIHSMV